MSSSIFENLQLNGSIINELYGNDMLILNNEKSTTKNLNEPSIERHLILPITPQHDNNPSIVSIHNPATQRVAHYDIFNDKLFHIIVFEAFLVEKDLIKQVMTKLLEARNKPIQYANVIVWKHSVQELIDCFNNEPQQRIAWVLGLPEQEAILETPLYKPISVAKVTALFTGGKQALTEQQYKLVIWEFIKTHIV
jgi:hypothetical protein